MSEKLVDLTHGDVYRLEDLVDRHALREVCRSFFDLFGLSIRVLSHDGSLLADVHQERSICRYVNGVAAGRVACSRVVGQAQQRLPDQQTVVHPCFTGAVYHILPINYDGRQLGRIVVGPFVTAEPTEPPDSLLQLDPQLEVTQARLKLLEMPHVSTETASRIAAHLQGMLELILFSGLRSHLTREMHLASIRDSYKQLAENNARLQKAYEELKDLDRLKSNFLASVSHELRTPLTAVIGYAEMLTEGIGGTLTDEQKNFVETIRGKGELLLELITNLLDLNKLERNDITLDLQEVDPRAVLTDVGETLLPEATKRGVNLQVECEPDVPVLNADLMKLRQILMNLANNAVKFTPEGGNVCLSAHRCEMERDDASMAFGIGHAVMMAPAGAVEFVVSDTGIGMAEEELAKIFDAFYQVDGSSTREYDGTGLGLSIAKRLTDAHKGRLRVESQPRAGTAFYLRLPEDPSSP